MPNEYNHHSFGYKYHAFKAKKHHRVEIPKVIGDMEPMFMAHCGRFIRRGELDRQSWRVWGSNVTPDWSKVTCKKCLRFIPPTIWERIRPTAWERIGG